MFTFKKLRQTRKPDVVIGPDYLRRWWLIPRNKWFNIYLHEINNSDDDRALHDHPWYNLSVVLQGGYVEVTPTGRCLRRAGQLIFRKGTALHRLEIGSTPAITLFITGPKYRSWGFACPKGWRHWREFVSPFDTGQVGRGCE